MTLTHLKSSDPVSFRLYVCGYNPTTSMTLTHLKSSDHVSFRLYVCGYNPTTSMTLTHLKSSDHVSFRLYVCGLGGLHVWPPTTHIAGLGLVNSTAAWLHRARGTAVLFSLGVIQRAGVLGEREGRGGGGGERERGVISFSNVCLGQA